MDTFRNRAGVLLEDQPRDEFMNARSATALLAGLLITHTAFAADPAATTEHARGRYLIAVGGCNDCHSPGYAESGGALPEAEWLTGSNVGFQGPWGTTYAGNLRASAATLDEAAWLALARTPLRPPMPSPSLRAMTDADLVAVYRFIRGLGPAGQAVPAYVPPGGAVRTPYVDFTPRSPSGALARN